MTSDKPDTKKDPIGHGADTAEAVPVIETKPAGIDWAEINARIEQQRAAAREKNPGKTTDSAAAKAANQQDQFHRPTMRGEIGWPTLIFAVKMM